MVFWFLETEEGPRADFQETHVLSFLNRSRMVDSEPAWLNIHGKVNFLSNSSQLFAEKWGTVGRGLMLPRRRILFQRSARYQTFFSCSVSIKCPQLVRGDGFLINKQCLRADVSAEPNFPSQPSAPGPCQRMATRGRSEIVTLVAGFCTVIVQNYDSPRRSSGSLPLFLTTSNDIVSDGLLAGEDITAPPQPSTRSEQQAGFDLGTQRPAGETQQTPSRQQTQQASFDLETQRPAGEAQQAPSRQETQQASFDLETQHPAGEAQQTPSRQETQQASFDLDTQRNVTAVLGKAAYLVCKVNNLGNKTVSVTRQTGQLHNDRFGI